MQQGNEGDEIILLALSAIECNIGEIKSISEILPENIIEIVARSLWLISQGELKFPIVLPSNIASKHRICTEMAAKIKEMGYSGDCGYNQLLYPVESQTRGLLTWLVQRLPRSDDEIAEDVLGANALLNKRMTTALLDWKSKTWKLHFCAKKSSAGRVAAWHTCPNLHAGMCEIFAKSMQSNASPSSSVLEKHSLGVIRDVHHAARLERDFADADTAEDSSSTTAKNLLRNAFTGVKQVKGASGVGSKGSAAKELEQMGQTLQEVMQAIGEDAVESSSSKTGRSTAFMHSTEFSQENSTLLIQETSSSSSAAGAGAGAVGTRAARGEGKSTSKSGSQEEEDDDNADFVRPASTRRTSTIAADERKAKQEREDKLRLEELENLRQQLLELEAKVGDAEQQQSNLNVRKRQGESEMNGLQQEGERLEKEIILKRKTLEMLPSAIDNIAKLQTICGNSAKRLMQLAQEWEQHRRPLVDKLRDLKSSKTRRRNKCKQMVEDMKRCRQEMMAMVQDLKEKQERSQILAEEVGKLPRNINRTLYTYRIMDIIASIGKQNKEIDKITVDIREIQKTINSNANSLQRADAITEEMIYAAANGPNSDSAMVDSYRQLITLRTKFDSLIATVNKVGQLDKQARDLETKVSQEVARVSANNFDRIRSDLEQVQGDNQKLVAQLKAMSRK